jgi:hypothetical protein
MPEPIQTLLLAGLAAAIPPPAAAPLRLEVDTSGKTTVVTILGESLIACTASYRLEVSDARSGNRSVTAGSATLQPGVRQTVAKVALGPDSARTTLARLHVEPCGGKIYEQAWAAQ